MVDHGKRSGIEHFAKIIIWAGRNQHEKKDGKPKPFKKPTMKEKRDLLVLDEIRVLAAEGKASDGIEPRNVKYIVPQSTEMKELAARINSS